MITKNYIKMCVEAEEIQKAWKPVDWDRFIYKDDREFGIACVDKGHDKKDPNTFWIPTQEQLWEKIWEIEKTCTFNHSFDISKFDKDTFNLVVRSISNKNGYISEYLEDTIQGCLLQYICETEYDKSWTGEKWVKAE